MSSDGPPARNTRSSARERRAREIHGVLSFDERPTPRQEQPEPQQERPTPSQSVTPARSENSAPRDESVLTPITGSPSSEQIVSEEDNSEDNAPSEHSTIREASEETEQEHEQSYSTAPTIAGPSTDPAEFSTPHASVPRDKGKGRATSVSTHEGTRYSSHSSRDVPPHLAQADDDWNDLKRSLGDWSAFAKKTKTDAVKQRQEWKGLESKIIDTYHHSTTLEQAVVDMLGTIERLQLKIEARSATSDSPRSRTRPIEQSRVEDEDYSSYPQTMAEHKLTPTERYTMSMAKNRTRATRKMQRGRASGPPVRTARRGGGDPGEEPSDSSDHADAEDFVPRDRIGGEHHDPDQYGRVAPYSGDSDNYEVDPTTYYGQAHDTLEQDYARRSASVMPQQLAGPMMIPAPVQGPPIAQAMPQARRQAPRAQLAHIAPQMPAQIIPRIQGHPGPDHETNMVDNLRRHIRESLTGIPNDLPELKGLRAKLPEAYQGEDDFDRLDNWLQGLLRFYKLHRLTGMDKDTDRVLVVGTCLKGKAERWFRHEVERPTRIIRNWNFESVIVGLFRTFITTATAQQAMQRYAQVRFSREEGVTAFYRDLLMWAGRLAQYPDPYSFKRRLLKGMPAEYRQHLALYDGISAEHSSIDDIVQKARQLEKTLISLKLGQGTDKPSTPASTSPAGSGYQRPMGSQEKTRSRSNPTRRQQGRVGVRGGSQPQRATTKPSSSGDRGKATTQTQGSPKGDTSKLTCYRCGKVGHIASDPKCPQYKKTEQRQIFAAQIVDDRSESGQPDQSEPIEDSENPAEPNVDETNDAAAEESPSQEDSLEGSQYEDEESSYDEYDGYAPPSEDDELEYIRAMGDVGEASTSLAPDELNTTSTPISFDDVNWQVRRDAVKDCHQRAPWMPGADWEFTPRFGKTHIRNCEICAQYKEHLIVAEVINKETISSAWKIGDQYEQKLVRLGWDLAHEGGQLSPTTFNAVAALEIRNHQLELQLAALHRASRVAAIRNKELMEALEHERLDTSLREGEVDFLEEECKYLKMKCTELKDQLMNNQQNIISSPKDEDIEMRSENPDTDTPMWDGKTSLKEGVGIAPRKSPARMFRPENFSGDSSHQRLSDDAVARLAAVRDDAITPREREFRAAQRRNFEVGERPRTFGSDRRCMAALIKVNGLQAYALLDSGSTTVSVTHDFARVAKLDIMQLENPVPLQLGTVGSRSMINFGTKTRLELGPVLEHDAYLDVVNIDRYDMIVGTPFMRKHGLVLNFADDTLNINGKVIETLTSSQEDLMLAKRRAQRARAPTTSGARTTRTSE